ncbi:DUF808 domain-containing protein [Gynuella sp.]|uniref:DUF808 domain-containing protein n=1 Tax=Gynuella sp. TaxID=2969146 RepID=UPI003D0A2D88
MAGSSLLALIDDIATLLDDIAVMSKVAAKKTAAVLGDDLALNAEQVTGVKADRELPVVWAVTKGSLLNKVILVPAALLISAVAPWLITPLLMLGGAYLCFEGFEKVWHLFHTPDAEHKQQRQQVLQQPDIDLVAYEKNKVKGAIRTDFILSAEIVVIALGTVQGAPFITQVGVVAGIAFVMTLGVYALVAAIVKIDDAGLFLISGGATGLRAWFGRFLLKLAPYLMKTLSIAGTVAMFLVGGGILSHGLPGLAEVLHSVSASTHSLPAIGMIVGGLLPSLINCAIGLAAGGLVYLLVEQLIGRWFGKSH